MDEENRIGVLVSDHKQQPQEKVSVYVKGDLKQKAEGETDKDGEIILPETPATAEWQSAYIVGYTDGTFRPEAQMTRAEAVTIISDVINNLLGRSADSEYISNNGRRLNTFSDVYAKHWAYAAILEAANSHNAVVDKETETWNR